MLEFFGGPKGEFPWAAHGSPMRVVRDHMDYSRSVDNPPAFIALGGAQAWPYAMAAHWCSRLRIGHGKGVREQGTEPGTLVTGQISGATAGPWTLTTDPGP